MAWPMRNAMYDTAVPCMDNTDVAARQGVLDM